jgi:DNA-binding XRE family transcriptional regulator
MQIVERARLSAAILPSVDWKRVRAELARLRNDEGLTLDELAASSGVDRSTIHRIEKQAVGSTWNIV